MSTDSTLKSAYDRFRSSNRFAVFIVYTSLMVDSMLLSVVAPILPAYFYNGETPQKPSHNHHLVTTMTLSETSQSVTNAETYTTDVLCDTEGRKNVLEENNLLLSFILASKPFVQVFANSAVGPLVDRVGSDVPMFAGYIVTIVSSTTFAFGETYAVLFFARAVQGIGSALSSASGLAMLAERYKDDDERGRMIGIALGGLAMGVLVGPVFGSVTYQYAGKAAPFLILSGATCILAILQLISRKLQIVRTSPRKNKSSLIKLLKDPYISLTASVIVLGNMAIAIVEAGMSTWLIMTMCAEKWMLGVAMLPSNISYMLATIMVSRFIKSKNRWLVGLVSCYLAAAGTFALPFCKIFPEIIGPGVLIGTAVGMMDTTMIPTLGFLADTRHSSLYGSAFAIADASFCIAFVIGSLITGIVVRTIGFKWLMIITSIINFVFAPLVYFLRDPPPISEEKLPILDKEISECKNYGQRDTEISSFENRIEGEADENPQSSE